MVNPPSKSAAYWLHEHLHETPGGVAGGVHPPPDTWWHAWARWIEARAGERIRPPAAPGSDAIPPLADAPGLYVTER